MSTDPLPVAAEDLRQTFGARSSGGPGRETWTA